MEFRQSTSLPYRCNLDRCLHKRRSSTTWVGSMCHEVMVFIVVALMSLLFFPYVFAHYPIYPVGPAELRAELLTRLAMQSVLARCTQRLPFTNRRPSCFSQRVLARGLCSLSPGYNAVQIPFLPFFILPQGSSCIQATGLPT
jgi:hypothetical protein